MRCRHFPNRFLLNKRCLPTGIDKILVHDLVGKLIVGIQPFFVLFLFIHIIQLLSTGQRVLHHVELLAPEALALHPEVTFDRFPGGSPDLPLELSIVPAQQHLKHEYEHPHNARHDLLHPDHVHVLELASQEQQ